MVCDDDAVTRLLVTRIIVGNLGWLVTQCRDGAEALIALGGEQIDAAILDISMPHIDGIALVEAIRRSEKFRTLPILMLTSDHREDVVRRLLQLGVKDYIVKPPDVESMVAKLTKLCPPQ